MRSGEDPGDEVGTISNRRQPPCLKQVCGGRAVSLTFSRTESAMSSQEQRQLLGTCSLTIDEEERKVDVYEFRYLWQHRTGIELVDRQNVDAGTLAVLSTNAPEVPLEPGEFIVNTYSENKDLWQQMERFPEFEETGKSAVLPVHDHECPIWRLRCYDRCPSDVRKNNVESGPHFTGVIERLFANAKEIKAKRQYKDVIASSQLIDALKILSQALCESDFFSEDAENLKHNEKWLTKDMKGRWKIERKDIYK